MRSDVGTKGKQLELPGVSYATFSIRGWNDAVSTGTESSLNTGESLPFLLLQNVHSRHSQRRDSTRWSLLAVT